MQNAKNIFFVVSCQKKETDLATRVWVNSGDYWTVNFDIIEAVKAAFDKEGIEIPFNQLDVHVKND